MPLYLCPHRKSYLKRHCHRCNGKGGEKKKGEGIRVYCSFHVMLLPFFSGTTFINTRKTWIFLRVACNPTATAFQVLFLRVNVKTMVTRDGQWPTSLPISNNSPELKQCWRILSFFFMVRCRLTGNWSKRQTILSYELWGNLGRTSVGT